MKSVNISIKYSSVAVTKFVCKEIWQKNHFTLLQEKESKLLYSRYCIRSLFLSTNNKSVMLQIFTLRGKTSIILHYFARKEKYHITSRSSKLSWERFLETFVILIEESFYLIARKGK